MRAIMDDLVLQYGRAAGKVCRFDGGGSSYRFSASRNGAYVGVCDEVFDRLVAEGLIDADGHPTTEEDRDD